jgi:iron complex outermembrane receptor protein
VKDSPLQVFVEGRNLGNAEAREHTSFLKGVAPLPGRNVRVGLVHNF